MKSDSSYTFVRIRHACTPKFKASFLIAAILFLNLAGNVSYLGATVHNKNFPIAPAIQANVTFWEKIYSTYSTSEAVIHDKHDLTKIYGVIPIIDYLLPGAGQLNKPILETAKLRYSAILNHLAQGNPPRSKEEHRIAAMYKGARKSQLLKARESIRAQIGQKERFREGVIRSGAYLSEIRRIFRSYNLPEELAYLPHVESSFNPDAYSKVGASGLWQFTRSTGKAYMRIDNLIDERQDPIIASHAAAKFLKKNHTLLESWPLALTAYNYGTSGMMRAKRDKGSYEKIFLGYQEGYFKFASRNFYPEFLAALRVAQKIEQDPSLRRHKPTPTTTVRLKKHASVATISRNFKVNINTIKALNPAIKASAFQGKQRLPQGYQLKLPVTAQNQTKQAITIKANQNITKNRIYLQ
ncbi:MAG: lytic transglycosylase domain-containing protein [Proteobacteria bacterium]|nr:lytic transglycosylase domain-containing protein [Pseudomonadota bacterium]MBU1649564.1 lytic transglycosylase domain-containing protein [Pseudomonadota bacterium]